MFMSRLNLIAAALLWISTTADAAQISFESHIRPLLKAHCFHCHGEESELAGGLDLRLKRFMTKGGDSGPAIVPGRSGESLLIEYVSSGAMPPKEEEHLSKEQIQMLREWIDTGAPLSEAEPATDPQPGELIITAAERSHWAYQPLTKPSLPASTAAHNTHPIDAFISQKLTENQLDFSPQAGKVTLIRRATFDLTGLLPTPEEVNAFVNDPADNAYEKVIDRLLASPQYGERWGRHWLDAAGYADSEGYDDKDIPREDAWHYRDYVIRSFNADKPWDRFILEQLAGDELVQATTQSAETLANQNPQAQEALTATGFLRMAPDGTASTPMDPVLARNQVITETIKIVSSSLLASTVACAECHHHRFDPIPQEDFYRLRSVLAPVYNLEQWRAPAARRISILSAEEKQQAAEIEAEAKKLDAARNQAIEAVVNEILGRVLESIPEAEREFARNAFLTPVKDRTPEQTKFVIEQYPMLGLLNRNTLHLFLERFKDGKDLKKTYDDIGTQAAELRKQKPTPQIIRVANELPGQVPDTFVFHRGDHTSPTGQPVTPGGLALFQELEQASTARSQPDQPVKTSARRLNYAKFLVSGKHPLVARVLVNRFWHHHFGRGIVDTLGDFGTQGSLPSHPELLDWLAVEFMEQGWSLKKLHRTIMTSRTYQQSSQKTAQGVAIDFDNRLLWRMPVQRREAEAVRDGILFVSGEMNPEMYGPPIPVATNKGGILTVGGGTVSEDRKELKRTVYIQVRRTTPVAMLQAFDAPQMEPNCERRVVSTVATQSLALLNSDFVLKQSQAFATRIQSQLTQQSTPADQATLAWQLAYSRSPSAEELQMATDYLQAQTTSFTENKTKEPAHAALASLCQILFSSNEFLYVD